MTTEQVEKKYAKPSELLEDMDSHAIQNVRILDGCGFDTSTVPRFTVDETAQMIRDRGLGGTLEASADDILIFGWTTSAALAKRFLGSSPGDRFHGRGSAFRADKTALREAGF